MPELRKDLVRNNWVVIANGRALKPNDFPINKQGLNTAGINGFCPFCEGNEKFTTSEIVAIRAPGSQPDAPGWSVRTIPNKFSAFILDGMLQKEQNGIYSCYNSLGKHEVVVETPEHGIDLHEYSIERIELIIDMLKNRYTELSKDERIKYIHIYKNKGLFAGASLGHSHSQVVGLPLVPLENRGIAEYYRKTGRCLLCDILEQELRDQERIVYATDLFLVICPYAARFSYETWVVPREHQAHFGGINLEQVKQLATIWKALTSAVVDCLDNPSYNVLINAAPVNMPGEAGGYHWFIEITPRLLVMNALESGTGYYINPVAPELSARILAPAFTIS